MKILIVDDNTKDIERLRKWLTEEGAQVRVCHSGAEAERVIDVDGASFEVAFILWDVRGMPSGLELLTRCRRNFPKLQTIVTACDLTSGVAATAKSLGAKAFLLKPFDRDRVMDCLRSVVASERPELPLIAELRRRMTGESREWAAALREVAKVIPRNDHRVLLLGETGTGKEMIARAIHDLGASAGSPFFAVNLRTIPPSLVERELFGHERGAFTDAREARAGYFEQAANGTLFLDEVGELTAEVQVALLRVLQEKVFRRIGAASEKQFNARLICATNIDLVAAAKEGRFRNDLFFRIFEVTISVPALRDRKDDIPILLQHFLDKYRGARKVWFTREALSILNSHSYIGNVRELEGIVRGALVKCEGERILPDHLDLQTLAAFSTPATPPESIPPARTASAQEADSRPEEARFLFPKEWLKLPYHEAQEQIVRAFDRIYLHRKLEEHGHVKSRAADAAKIDRKTFDQRLERAGLSTKKNQESPPGDEEEESNEPASANR